MDNVEIYGDVGTAGAFSGVPEYDLSDYLIPESFPAGDNFSSQIFATTHDQSDDQFVANGSSTCHNIPIATSSSSSNIKYKNGRKKYSKMEGQKPRIAFRIKSELETIDDGFKWRKYGKKMVKTSPNPRNYYKCSSEGCGVKKRVERDKEDSSHVIATYEGIHNHQSPCLIYYPNNEDMLPLAQHSWP